MTTAVPAWPGEDFACPTCALSYPAMAVPDVVDDLLAGASALAAVAVDLPDEVLRARPAAGGWAAIEYVCHVRDVHVVGTIRLHRTRTEDAPVLEPMLNDLRARRFDYRARELRGVLDELTAAARGVAAEVARVTDWDRVGVRVSGDAGTERRTARWLLRQLVHETVHHRHDIEDLG